MEDISVEPQVVTPDNVLQVDVPKLALNPQFGTLVFENANKKLAKVQKWLNEAEDLGYRELLLPDDVNTTVSFVQKLAEYLEWLRNFDIGAVDNAKQQHDDFESKIDGFFNSVYQHLVMRYLPFLREEKRREQPDQQKLEDEVRKASQLRVDLEKELQDVRRDVEKIRTTGKEVGSAKGERAAVRLATYFKTEAQNYRKVRNYWLIAAIIAYALVVFILLKLGQVAGNYFEKIIQAQEKVGASAIWSLGAGKLVIAAALWYGLSFIVKNYNVNSHFAAINLHRAAVARTLEDFIAAEQQQEKPRLSEMLQNAADAMFKHAPIGFVSRTEKESSPPVLKVVNDIVGIKEN